MIIMETCELETLQYINIHPHLDLDPYFLWTLSSTNNVRLAPPSPGQHKKCYDHLSS